LTCPYRTNLPTALTAKGFGVLKALRTGRERGALQLKGLEDIAGPGAVVAGKKIDVARPAANLRPIRRLAAENGFNLLAAEAGDGVGASVNLTPRPECFSIMYRRGPWVWVCARRWEIDQFRNLTMRTSSK